MSDFSRLEAVIGKLRQRARAPGEGRKLRGGDAAGLLASLVTEIDETILPRDLTFSCETGPVRLAVANRRLQAVLNPLADGMPAELADHAFPDASDPKLAVLGDALLAHFEGRPAVQISSSRQAQSYPSDIGVPADQLARAWSVSATTAKTPAELLKTFLSGLDPEAFAWLQIEGEAVTDQGGPEDKLADLAEQTAVFLDGYFSKFDEAFRHASQSCATLVAPPGGTKRGLFFIEIGEISASVTGPASALPGIAQTWQAGVAE